jgi:anti-sigma factor RsiW
MTCREVVEFLADYLSGGLPAAQRATFEEHIAECKACVAYLRSYERSVKLTRGAFKGPECEPPPEIPEELVDAILAARKRRR